MADELSTLHDMYPALGEEISEAARRGFSPDDIRTSIADYQRELRGQGASSGDVYQATTGRPLAPGPTEEPTLGNQISSMILRGGPALAGAAIGSFLGPPGTIAGGLIGGGIGGVGGEALARKVEGKPMKIAPLAVGGALGAIPGFPAKTVLGHVLGGLALGTGAGIAQPLAEGERPTLGGTAIAAATGGALGGTVGAVSRILASLRAGKINAAQARDAIRAAQQEAIPPSARRGFDPRAGEQPRDLSEAGIGPVAPELVDVGTTYPYRPSEGEPLLGTTGYQRAAQAVEEDLARQRVRPLEEALSERGPARTLADLPREPTIPEEFAARAELEGLPGMSPRGSGVSVLSNEELARTERFIKFGRNGEPTHLGKQPDATLAPGEAILAIDPKGKVRVQNAEGLTDAQALQQFGKQAKRITKRESLLAPKAPKIYDLTPAVDDPIVEAPLARLVEPTAKDITDPSRLITPEKIAAEGKDILAINPDGSMLVSDAHLPTLDPTNPTKAPARAPREVGFGPAEMDALRAQANEAGLRLRQIPKDPLQPDGPILGYALDDPKTGERLGDMMNVRQVRDYLNRDNALAQLKEPPSLAPIDMAARSVESSRPSTPRDIRTLVADYVKRPTEGREFRRVSERAANFVTDIIANPAMTLEDIAKEYGKALREFPRGDQTILREAMATRRLHNETLIVKMMRDKDGVLRRHLCTSPCEPLAGQIPTFAAVDDAEAYLMSVASAHAQQRVALANEGFLHTFRRRWSEGTLGAHFRSASMVANASGDPRAIRVTRTLEEMVRQESRFVSGEAKLANEKLRIKEGSPEDYQLGQLMDNPRLRENPQYIKSLPKDVREAYEHFTTWLGDKAQVMGLPREHYLPNYFTHVFSARELSEHTHALLDMLHQGRFPEGVRPEHVQKLIINSKAVLQTIAEGKTLGWEQLPSNLKETYFKQRLGAEGYSLSAVKAWNTYLNFSKKKLVTEPMLAPMVSDIQSLQADGKVELASYLSDVVRNAIFPKSPTGSVARIAGVIREGEFARTLGFFSIPSALRNFVGGQLFSAVEAGPKHFIRGVELALEANRGRGILAAQEVGPSLSMAEYLAKTYDVTGHAESMPVMFQKRGGLGGEVWRKLLDAGAVLFNSAERGNRKVSWFTGISKFFDTATARAQGWTLENTLRLQRLPTEAVDFANDFVHKTQFRYGVGDPIMALEGPIAKTVMQYSTFQVKAMELMWRWATQDGPAGKAKLLTLGTIGLGLGTATELAGVDFQETFGMPIDFVSAVRTLQSLRQEDFAAAKRNALKIAAEAIPLVGGGRFNVGTGPIVGLGESLKGIVEATKRGDRTDKLAFRMLERDISPTQVTRITNAYRDYTMGGTPADFLMAFSGIPNKETRVRIAMLHLLEDGEQTKAMNLITEWRKLMGGAIPVNWKTASQEGAAGQIAKRRRELEKLMRTPREKARRTLPFGVQRLVQ